MADLKITTADLAGKGVVGLPDTPGLATLEMQQKFDEIASDVIVPRFNRLIDALAEPDGAALIGAAGGTLASHVESLDNPHAVTAAQTGAYSRAETDAQIAQKMIEAGAGDMTKSVYDANGNGVVDDSEKLGGQPPGYYATKEAVDGAIPKSGAASITARITAGYDNIPDNAGYILRGINVQDAAGADVATSAILLRRK